MKNFKRSLFTVGFLLATMIFSSQLTAFRNDNPAAGQNLNAAPSEVYLGQIMLWASNEVPRGFVKCDGSTLSTRENAALHSLLGNHFGGNESEFAVPDLHDKAPRGYHYIIATMGIYPNAAK